MHVTQFFEEEDGIVREIRHGEPAVDDVDRAARVDVHAERLHAQVGRGRDERLLPSRILRGDEQVPARPAPVSAGVCIPKINPRDDRRAVRFEGEVHVGAHDEAR